MRTRSKKARGVVRSHFHKLVGEAISWAGKSPWTGSLGFGTESGLFFGPGENDIEAVLVADDAINGIAFSGTLAAFTSRESLYVGRQKLSGHIELTDATSWSIGAHGVAASRHGAFFVNDPLNCWFSCPCGHTDNLDIGLVLRGTYTAEYENQQLSGSLFFVPVGPQGVLAIGTKVNGLGFEARTIQGAEESWYAYQLIRVGEAGSGEVFAFAARSNGVFVFTYYGGWELSPISNHFFRGRDIISVSPLNHPAFPLGVIAMSRSGEIMAIPRKMADRNMPAGKILGSPCGASGKRAWLRRCAPWHPAGADGRGVNPQRRDRRRCRHRHSKHIDRPWYPVATDQAASPSDHDRVAADREPAAKRIAIGRGDFGGLGHVGPTEYRLAEFVGRALAVECTGAGFSSRHLLR
jgi:hypothetical protein